MGGGGGGGGMLCAVSHRRANGQAPSRPLRVHRAFNDLFSDQVFDSVYSQTN